MDRRFTRSKAVRGVTKKSSDSNSEVDTTSNSSKTQQRRTQKKKAPVKPTPARTTRQTVARPLHPLAEITLSGDEEQSDASATSDDEQHTSSVRSKRSSPLVTPPVIPGKKSRTNAQGAAVSHSPAVDKSKSKEGEGKVVAGSSTSKLVQKPKPKIRMILSKRPNKGNSQALASVENKISKGVPPGTATKTTTKTKQIHTRRPATSESDIDLESQSEDDTTGDDKSQEDMVDHISSSDEGKEQENIKEDNSKKGLEESEEDESDEIDSIELDASNEPPEPRDDTETGTDLESCNSENSILMKRTKIEGQKGHSSSSCDTAIRVQPKPKVLATSVVLANETVIVDSGAERDEQGNDETEPLNMSKQEEEPAVNVNLNEQEEGVAMDDSIVNMTYEDVRKAYLFKKAQLVGIEIYVKRLEAAKLEKELGLQPSNFTAELY